ncbi:MAG: nitroreductase [Deltaproteobacteria bacterium]|nr:nitroreductase [Deltaproteobacteria bacterium]
MELSAALKERRSIRAFKTDPVPKKVIEQILEGARWSPSWGNTQPWELVVVQGNKARELTRDLVAAFEQKVPANPDVAMPASFPHVYKERYMACAAGLFGSMGVARDDKVRRMAHMVNMTGGFGAPAIIYVIFNADLAEPYSMFDLGLLSHAICLMAHDLGLGTCIEAQLALYPDIIRRHLGLGSSHKIVVGLALGYPDLDHPANAFRTEREPLETFVRWIE